MSRVADAYASDKDWLANTHYRYEPIVETPCASINERSSPEQQPLLMGLSAKAPPIVDAILAEPATAIGAQVTESSMVTNRAQTEICAVRRATEPDEQTFEETTRALTHTYDLDKQQNSSDGGSQRSLEGDSGVVIDGRHACVT